jgi:hypothetical protein
LHLLMNSVVSLDMGTEAQRKWELGGLAQFPVR